MTRRRHVWGTTRAAIYVTSPLITRLLGITVKSCPARVLVRFFGRAVTVLAGRASPRHVTRSEAK